MLVSLGNYYEKQFDEGDKDAGVKALEAYSNAGEIDTTALVLLAKCYERGVGCDVNLEWALELREKSGEHSSAAASKRSNAVFFMGSSSLSNRKLYMDVSHG